MTLTNSMKRVAIIQLLREGLVTHDEAADLAATSRQLVQDWALRRNGQNGGRSRSSLPNRRCLIGLGKEYLTPQLPSAI